MTIRLLRVFFSTKPDDPQAQVVRLATGTDGRWTGRHFRRQLFL